MTDMRFERGGIRRTGEVEGPLGACVRGRNVRFVFVGAASGKQGRKGRVGGGIHKGKRGAGAWHDVK